MIKFLLRMKIKWAQFKFALVGARKEFHLRNTDIVELTVEHLNATTRNKILSDEEQFMMNWEADTKMMIQEERTKMAKEGIDMDKFIKEMYGE